MILRKVLTTYSLALTMLTSLTTSRADDWPSWRGATRDDHSNETGLLKTWPAEGPKLDWIFKNAGIGYSGPAIVEGKLYTLCAREDAEQLLCLNAATGEELWATEIGPVLKNQWGDGPRATPSVDSGYVYAMSAQGHLNCISLADHKVVWKKKMEELGGKLPGWGYTESVLVDAGLVICTPGGDKGAVAALDKKTGELKWQTQDLKKEAWYSSPVAATMHGKKLYIQMVHDHVVGIDATTGNILWRTDWRGKVAAIPTPIVSGNSVYITSGYGVGCKKVTIGADMVATTDFDLEKEGITNHHGGVILLDGKIYGHSDKGGWSCQDLADGKVLWTDKSLGKGAVGYADGKLYCVSEDDGTVVLADASPTGWKESGRFKLSPQTALRKKDGRIWTHPVISNGKLYLRDQDLIYCFNVRS